MDIFSPTIIDNALITGSNNASLLQVSSPSAASAFFISGSGNVGIGTTSPISTLTVAGGNININDGYSIGGNALGSYVPFLRYNNTGAGVPSSSFGHTTAFITSLGGGVFGTNDLIFYAGGLTQTEIMRIVGSTGFIGIGESSPSAKLEIKGSGATSATTALRVENSNASASLTILNDGTSAFNISHLYVSSSGFIGVGTTLPTAELHISGNNADTLLRVSSATQTNVLLVSGSGFIGVNRVPGVALDVTGDIRASGTMFNGSTQTQRIQANSITFVQFLSASVETARYDNNGWGFFNTTPTAKVHISGASADSLLRVGSPAQANALFVSGSGNVGIGTTNPIVRLHLSQSSGIFQRVDINNSNADGVNATTEYYTNTGATADLFGATSFRLQGGTTDAFKQFQIYIANLTSPKFIVNGSGNVGIGITSPTTRLHISGASNAGLFEIDSPAVNNIIYVSGSGNVGIGTNLPSAELHISGASADSLLRVGSPTNSDILFVTGSGRVGIGISTPSALFEVNDKIIAEAGGNVGIQTAPSDWVHLSSDPGASKYLNIDAAQTSNSPPLTAGTAKDGYGIVANDIYLAEPDSWMEIKLGGAVVLIPCYFPQ